MLKHLTINNYILIEFLDIDMQPGFSVMTGETGAGKSIILGALGLLMGQRADSQCLTPGAAKCFVEGTFDVEGYDLEDLFEEHELDYDPAGCTLRREVSAAGKSRAFVNDTPVNLTALKQIAFRLFDIHSQHSNLLLERASFQLNIVDVLADHPALLSEYQQTYARIVALRRSFQEVEEAIAKSKNDEDYLRYQLEQLESFKPQPGEDEELQQLQNKLTHAGDIKLSLSTADALLSGDDSGEALGAIDAIHRACQALRQVERVYPAAEEFLNRLDAVAIELDDMASDLNSRAEDVEYNPERLQQVSERLDTLYALEQKHHVDSAEELIALAENLSAKLALITDSEDTLQQLQQQINIETENALKLSAKLSTGRVEAAKQVESQIGDKLVAMDMPSARFVVEVKRSDDLLPTGQDVVTFLFSSNKTMSPRSLVDVASGGEMSRVMLALKALTSQKMKLPTIIFDEIDTGVSGKVASSMAQIMAQMSSDAAGQVLAITHLPQIAAQAHAHFHVYKEEKDGRTFTRIRQLSDEERITEVAHMLSGASVTEAAMENARQLLQDK